MNTPRPVRRASQWLGAIAAVAGLVPTVGTEFEWIAWTTGQVNAYTLAVGTLIAAAALVLGVQVEKVVTPTANPRDDAGRLLTPGPIGATSTDPDGGGYTPRV